MKNISHVTSVHHYMDTRIFVRECKSLSKKYNVTVYCTNIKDTRLTEFKYKSIKRPNNRLFRICIISPILILRVLLSDNKIVHLHDPELFIYTNLLKLFRKKVIIDIHEDYLETINHKHYLGTFSKKIISYFFDKIYIRNLRKADLIIAAWPAIKQNLQSIGIHSTLIRNFPEITNNNENRMTIEEVVLEDEIKLLFSGLISFERGIKEAVALYEGLKSRQFKVKLYIIGRSKNNEVLQFLHTLKNDENIIIENWLDQNELYKLMNVCHFGFIFFHDIPNHRFSEPNKLFEYMYNGVVPIANKLPLLTEVIEGENVGKVVDINDVDYIDKFTLFIEECTLNNGMYNKLRLRGFNAVVNKYNWEEQESFLFKAYENL